MYVIINKYTPLQGISDKFTFCFVLRYIVYSSTLINSRDLNTYLKEKQSKRRKL